MVEAHAAHAAALHDRAGGARTFFGQAACPAVRTLNREGAPTLLPAIHPVVKAVRQGLRGPEEALYGNWME